MKRLSHLLITVVFIATAGFAFSSTPQPGSSLAFIPNQGQIITDQGMPAAMVHYKASVPGLEFYITDDGISYVFQKHNHDEYDPALGGEPDPDFQTTTDFGRMDMILKGANINSSNVSATHPSPQKFNYYYAHCPQGITGVEGYYQLTYSNVYPNIDWVIYSVNGKELKYEFVVHPGGDPSDIKMEYKWADLTVNNTSIELSSPMGKITDSGLYAYNELTEQQVPAQFIRNGNVVSIDVNAPQNAGLVIDPSLNWSTYWGSSGEEQPQATVVPGNGLVYVAGYTNSTNYPTTNPGGGAYYQGTFGGSYDAFLVKFDTAGVLYWSTYYGGSSSEGSTSYTGISIASGLGGDFWMVGTTTSSNIPTLNPGGGAFYQGTIAGSNDFFIVRFDVNGVMEYGTYMGGSSIDGGTSHGNGADTDAAGNFYFSGKMQSTNFPLLNPGGGAYYDNTQNGADDLCIVKLSPTGQLLWSTIFGGSGDDMYYSMDLHVDKTNNKLYVGTCTYSTNLPFYNPGGGAYFDNTHNGGADAYLIRFDLNGVPEWSTVVGGSGNEWLSMSLATASDGDLAMITLVGSTNMPLVNPGGGAFHDATHNGGSWDMYLARFETNLAMSWSTYYGSSNNDHCQHNLTIDKSGNIIMAGVSDGNVAPPTYNPGAPHFYDGTKDARGTYCLVQYDPAGVMLWGTFWGGSGHDHLYGTVGGSMGISTHGDIFFSAETDSPDLPMMNPGGGAFYKNTTSGGKEGFVVKFDNDVNIPVLAVDLLSFTGHREGHQNQLNWSVANASEASKFILERDDNGSFEPIDLVYANGQSAFTYTDIAPLEGTNLYRLKAFDQNGRFTYSNVVEIRSENSDVSIEVYPNPARERVTLELNSDGNTTYQVNVYDLQGRELLNKDIPGSGKYTLDLGGLTPGAYLVTVSGPAGKVYQDKLIIH